MDVSVYLYTVLDTYVSATYMCVYVLVTNLMEAHWKPIYAMHAHGLVG